MADNELGQMTMALSKLDNIPYKTPKIIQFDDQVNRYYQYWECVVYRKDDTNSPIDFEICLGDLTTGGPSVTVNAGFKLSITDTLVTYTEYDNSTSGATTNSNTVTDLKDIIDLIKNDDTDNLCVLSILLHPRCNLEPEGNTQGNAVTQFTDWSGLYLYINKRIVNGTKPNSPFIMKIPNTSLSNFSIAINTKQNSVLQFQWNFNNDEFIYPELAMQCYEELSIHNSEEIPSKWFTVPYDMNNLDYYAQKKIMNPYMLGHIETLSWARITPDNENNINLEYILTNSSATLSYKYIYIGTLNNYNMLHTNILKLDEGSTWYEDDTDIFNQDLTYEVATSSYLFKDGLLFKIPNKSGDQITVYNIVNSSVSSVKTKNRTTTQDKYNILRFRLKFTDADKLNYCLEGASNETNLQDVFVQATQTTSLDSIECYDNLKASEFKDMVVIAANIDPDEDILNFGNRQGIHITYRDWSENKSYLSQNQTNFYWKSLFPYHRTYQFTYPLLNHPILLPYNLSNESNDWYLEVTMKKPPTNCFSYCLIGNGFNFDETDEDQIAGWNTGLCIGMNTTDGKFVVANYGYTSFYNIYESTIPTNQYTTISIRYNQDTSSKKSDEGNLVDVFIDGVKVSYTPPGTPSPNFSDNLGSLREILIHSTNAENNHQYTDNEDLGSIEINFGPNWKYPDLAQDLIDKDVSTIDYDTPTITISPYQFNVSMTLTEFSNLLQSKTGVVNIEKASTQMSLGKLVLTFSGGNELKNGASMLVSDDDDNLAGINYSSIDSDDLTASGLNSGAITNSNSSGNINNGELSFTYYYGLQPTPKTSLTGNNASIFYIFLAINSNGSAYNKSGEFDVVIPGITYDLYVKTTDIDEEVIPTTITPNITIHFTITQPEIEYIKQNVLKGHNFLLKESSGGGGVKPDDYTLRVDDFMEDIEDPFIDTIAKDKTNMFIYTEIPINIMTTRVNDNTPVYDHTHFDVSFSNERFQLIDGFDPLMMRVGVRIADGNPLYAYTSEVTVTLTLDSPYKLEDGTQTYTGRFNIVAKAPQKYWTITVTAGDYTKQQGQVDPAFIPNITDKDINSPCYYDGSIPGFTGTMIRDAGEGPDTYNILQGTLEFADNGTFLADYYNMNFVPGQLTIAAGQPPVGGDRFYILSAYYQPKSFTVNRYSTPEINTKLVISVDNIDCFKGNDGLVDNRVTISGVGIGGTDNKGCRIQLSNFTTSGSSLIADMNLIYSKYISDAITLTIPIAYTVTNKYGTEQRVDVYSDKSLIINVV